MGVGAPYLHASFSESAFSFEEELSLPQAKEIVQIVEIRKTRLKKVIDKVSGLVNKHLKYVFITRLKKLISTKIS